MRRLLRLAPRLRSTHYDLRRESRIHPHFARQRGPRGLRRGSLGTPVPLARHAAGLAVEVERAGIAQRAAGSLADAAREPVDHLAETRGDVPDDAGGGFVARNCRGALVELRLHAVLAGVELDEAGAMHRVDLRAMREEALPDPVARAGDRQHQHDEQDVAVRTAHWTTLCADARWGGFALGV